MEGKIHSIQTLGTVDGPGVRCVVFFQGCPLRCACCHNPDTWDKDGGEILTSKEVLGKILRLKSYFGDDGGVTLSGGEPLLQPEFAQEILTLCKENKINTALDTSGCILTQEVKKVIDLVDLILLDIKFKNNELYKKYTGGSMDTVMEFLTYANEKGKKIWIRQVILPGINDKIEDIEDLCDILKPFKRIEKIELLPFRKLCLEKYQMLGIKFPLEHLPETKKEKIEELQSAINKIFNKSLT